MWDPGFSESFDANALETHEKVQRGILAIFLSF